MSNQKHYQDLGYDMSSVWNSALVPPTLFPQENSDGGVKC